MLDGTPPQEKKLYRHLHVPNACEQSCIMMIMGGSKMFKTEYDFKAIIYPAYDTPHKLCNIRGNENIQHRRIPPPGLHSIMHEDPCVSSNAPCLAQVEHRVTHAFPT